MKPLDRMGELERAVVEGRSARSAANLVHFTDTESVLRALLERLLPGVAGHIDLALFVDRHAKLLLDAGEEFIQRHAHVTACLMVVKYDWPGAEASRHAASFLRLGILHIVNSATWSTNGIRA